jgi:hypothetical protein
MTTRHTSSRRLTDTEAAIETQEHARAQEQQRLIKIFHQRGPDALASVIANEAGHLELSEVRKLSDKIIKAAKSAPPPPVGKRFIDQVAFPPSTWMPGVSE